MKNIKSFICALGVAGVTFTFTGCNNEYDDVAPGSYVETERIETFPGDKVMVSGTVSNGSPISSVSLVCEEWGINHVYDRASYNDNVFVYEYTLEVPDDATFNQTLTITAKCKNGKSTVREIPISYLPDTSAPVATPAFNPQIGVEMDETSGKGVWNIDFMASDDRGLKSVSISIPSLPYNETIELSGLNASVKKTIEFTPPNTYPCAITIEDVSGNVSVSNMDVVAMYPETENPIYDYSGMYVVDANEEPDDYINGYYRYMDRKGEYQYEGKFYAATDDSKVYFTPERNLDGDLYGVSPNVSSKLMNNNGYVLPVTIAKSGYYGIYIDLKAHTYSISSLEVPENAYNGDLYLSGTGFAFGDDWSLSDKMTKVSDYRYEFETSLKSSSPSGYQYYFTNSDWTTVFRADAECKWWYEASEGTCAVFDPDEYTGEVIVTFDSAYPWGTIKKKNE